MKRIMKFTSLALAVMLAVIPLTGCGFMREKGSTLEINMDNSYRSEKMEVQYNYDILHSWENNILFVRRDGQIKHQDYYHFVNTETGESVKFEPKAAKERLAAGNSVHAYTVINYADGTIGIVIIEDNRYDGIIRRCIEIYDEKMNYVRTEEIPEDFAPDNYLVGWVDNQGNWYLGTRHEDSGTYTYDCYNSKYEKYGNIPLPSGYSVNEMVRSKEDGTMYAAITKNDGVYEVYEVNGAERTAESTGVFLHSEAVEKYEADRYAAMLHSSDFVRGNGEYDFCWMDNNGLYGYIDGEEKEILNWVNSDFPLGEINSCELLDNGTVVAEQGNESTHEFWLCSPRTQEEIDNTQLISLSSLGLYSALEAAVIDYNRAETGWRIIVVDYNKYNTADDKTLGAAKLQEDMLDGIVADMVCTNGMHFESLANKGLFADWYDLMDADESFSREDYLQNFFEAYEYDGKLQRLGVSYSVHSAAAKTEFAGTTEGVTLSEYVGFMDTIPQGMDFYDFYNREWFMEQYFKNRMNCWVDAKNAKCYFGTEFAKILEMIAGIPTFDEIDQLEAEGKISQVLPSYTESYKAFQENRAFIEDVDFYQPINFRAMNRTTFRDAEVTMVGMPMDYDEGNGGVFRTDFTVSVNAQSEHHEVIWGFMKHLLDEEYQSDLKRSMPVHLGALEAELEQATHMVTASVPFGMGESQIGESNPEEMGKLRAYLEGIRTAYYFNQKVYDIMMEEIAMYLSGDCTAQAAAEMIQSRVTIYLSEQS